MITHFLKLSHWTLPPSLPPSFPSYLVFPLVWSIPEALLTAELSSAFPECAGCVAWVNEAFGHPSWGYMRGVLSWLSGVMDNAIYPVLFVDYCATLDAGLALPLPRAVSSREKGRVCVRLTGLSI